ncbi:MAG TPA: carbohydrate ABC transporter permease [Ktedonosporobacter sp.]|nr:carbohydrate ABC transporter permease [Ktedonosporobacter sp.]
MSVRWLRTAILMGLGLLATSLMFFPIYWLVVTSLKPTSELFRRPPTFLPLHIDWTAYIVNVVQSPDLFRYIWNSAQLGLGTVLLSVGLGAPAAYALARLPLPGKNIFVLGVLMLQMFPGIMLAVPLYVMFSRLGLVNSLFAVSLAITTRTLPFAILMLRPFFLDLPQDLEEAAALDGCSSWGTFFKIFMPLSLPGLATVAAFNFLSGWSDFLFSLTLLTDDTKRPISMGLYRFISQYGVQWNDLMAVSVVAAIPAVAVFFFAQRYLIAGLTVGADR